MKKSLKILGVVVSIIILSIIVLVVKQYPELNRGKESAEKLVTAVYKATTVEALADYFVPKTQDFSQSKEYVETSIKSHNEIYGELKTISNIKIDLQTYLIPLFLIFSTNDKEEAIEKGYINSEFAIYTGKLIFEKKEEDFRVIVAKNKNGFEWKILYIDAF